MKPANLLIFERISKRVSLSGPRQWLFRFSATTVFLWSAFHVATLSSCVTVNIKLPESAVQRVTDDYVRELYKVKERKQSTDTEDSATAPTSFFKSFSLVSDAMAEEQDAELTAFKLDSPEVKVIQKEQAAIAAEITQFKRQGVLGESYNGQLVVKDASTVKPILKAKVAKLVEQENGLRTRLIDAAKDSSGASVDREVVERSLRKSFQKYSPSQTWLQAEDGEWIKKP